MSTTVPGANPNDPPITVSGTSSDVQGLAARIGVILSTIQDAGNLNTSVDSDGGSDIAPPPDVDPGTITELILNSPNPTRATIPAGYDYVIAVGTGGTTLTGSDVTIISGTIGSGLFVSGQSTVAAEGGDNTVSAAGNYNLSFGEGNNQVFLVGSGSVATGAGRNTVVGNGVSNVILTQGTGDLFVAAGGNNTVTALGDNTGVLGNTGLLEAVILGDLATVTAGQATTNVTISGGHALVYGGSGDSPGALDIVNNGSNMTVATFDSNATIGSTGDAAAIFGGSGTSIINVSGSNTTLLGGSGAETVTTSSNSLMFGGTGPVTFLGGVGTATIVGATGGSEQVTLGAGGGLFSAGSTNNATITGGAGTATLFGGANSAVNFVGSLAGGIFVAAGGNETLNAAGSSTSNLFSGGTAADNNILMVGGTSDDTMLAGAGSDTMTGGPGSDIFAFFATATNGAHDYITDFDGNDSVYLIGYDPSQTASTLEMAATGGGNTSVTLTLSDATQITFTNLTSTSSLDGHILYIGRG